MKKVFLSRKTTTPYLIRYWKSLIAFKDKCFPILFEGQEAPETFLAYICPLCTSKNFIWVTEGVWYNSNFSEDHYPPESVGSTKKVLACTKCNSDAGGAFDYALKELMTQSAFSNRIPKATLPVKSQISNVKGWYAGKLIIHDGGGLIMDLRPKKKNPPPFLNQWLKDHIKKRDWKVDMNFRFANNLKVSQALVKTAYLLCFETWGYDFIFSESGDMIRKYLSGNGTYPAPAPSFWLNEVIKSKESQQPVIGLCYFIGPQEIKCFAVNIILEDKQTGHTELVTVLVPDSSSSGIKILEEIQNKLPKGEVVEITMIPINECSLNQDEVYGYTKCTEVLDTI